jgi:hypothetical protein
LQTEFEIDVRKCLGAVRRSEEGVYVKQKQRHQISFMGLSYGRFHEHDDILALSQSILGRPL